MRVRADFKRKVGQNMKNEFLENEIAENELVDEIAEPMPLEVSEELLADFTEEGIDIDNVEADYPEDEENVSEDNDSLSEEQDAEALDEVGEGLLAEDELDEMELTSEYDQSEDEEAEPMVSAEENAEEPSRINELIENKKYAELKALLDDIPYVDIAEIFSEVESRYHAVILRLLGKEAAADVFVELDTDTQRAIIESFSDRELAAILEEMYLDDTVDIIEEMPAAVVKRIIKSSSKEDREMINRLLLFD